MGPFLRYTALRLLVLVVVGAALWAVGLRYLLWALVTVLVTAAVSYVLLARPRDALLETLSRSRPPPRDEDRAAADADAAAEDAALDAAAADRAAAAGDDPLADDLPGPTRPSRP